MSKSIFTTQVQRSLLNEVEKGFIFRALFEANGLSEKEYVRAIRVTITKAEKSILNYPGCVTTATLRDLLTNYQSLYLGVDQELTLMGMASTKFLGLLDKRGDISMILTSLFEMQKEGMLTATQYDKVKNDLLKT